MTDLSTLELLIGSYFTGPDDNPNFDLPEDAMRAAHVGEDVDACLCCSSIPSLPASGLCFECEAELTDAALLGMGGAR